MVVEHTEKASTAVEVVIIGEDSVRHGNKGATVMVEHAEKGKNAMQPRISGEDSVRSGNKECEKKKVPREQFPSTDSDTPLDLTSGKKQKLLETPEKGEVVRQHAEQRRPKIIHFAPARRRRFPATYHQLLEEPKSVEDHFRKSLGDKLYFSIFPRRQHHQEPLFVH